jgi:hypothetical protein
LVPVMFFASTTAEAFSATLPAEAIAGGAAALVMPRAAQWVGILSIGDAGRPGGRGGAGDGNAAGTARREDCGGGLMLAPVRQAAVQLGTRASCQEAGRGAVAPGLLSGSEHQETAAAAGAQRSALPSPQSLPLKSPARPARGCCARPWHRDLPTAKLSAARAALHRAGASLFVRARGSPLLAAAVALSLLFSLPLLLVVLAVTLLLSPVVIPSALFALVRAGRGANCRAGSLGARQRSAAARAPQVGVICTSYFKRDAGKTSNSGAMAASRWGPGWRGWPRPAGAYDACEPRRRPRHPPLIAPP